MNYIRTATPVDVLDTLKRFRDDALNAQILKSAWPVIERLIGREDEMRSVWNEIARYGLSWQQCHLLIEQIVFAGVHGRNEAVMQLKADYSQLANLNKDIVLIAKQLAAKLDAREHILNRNSFTLDNTVHIVELIDDAAAGNSRYRSCVREPLLCLGNYELKYWPSLQSILRTIAGEFLEIGFMDESDRALVYGRGELVPDYLRELFSRIELVRTSHWRLPVGFRLTDASLATLASVSLDLTEPVSNAAVKMHRTRLSKAGFSGAWPVRKKKSTSRKPGRDDRPVRTEPGA
ncbi:hypothetical protein ACKTG8_004183 [Cronobacter sakazakii]|uniref:hypothetical protein n=1 Tax=Cronobacter sakazakii TaxID=28141 RepID=UPI000A18BB74|nr:hypothetical protein [Cronobacter sakazakii]EKK3986587.1 hypothetical protein [Cronobacter sakazakii]EKK5222534.1 hypothetical protein [Cronobacter sakazakii]ELY2490493.1 hypothetical protein [Cronobacter sakazakii]ELY3731887.1 hypothetical protein [Cronobacter sakazakii]ELY3990127.1 hypothetical protein [Cronobacter sakazakii]